MSFYEDWYNCLLNEDDDFDYIQAFLQKKDYTKRILKNGSSKQIELFCKLLLEYDLNKIIDVIDETFYNDLTPAMIIQFSNFENGTTKLAELLYNKEDGMSYPEIGRALAGSEELNAATKYGENHSKLARDFELVSITEHKPTIVTITNFGRYFVFFDERDQMKLIKILGLRDPFIQNLIIKSKQGIVYYTDECNCLSDSTKIRRRSNVKKLLEVILEDINTSIGNNIIW